MSTRTLCLWCPDWPIVAARLAAPELADAPVAVVERRPRGMVVRAASGDARAEGVTIGLRRREAEAHCAGIAIVDADLESEARAFEPVAQSMDSITPGVVIERPGVLTFPTRGPSRYFGGDDRLAEHVLTAAHDAGVVKARVGVADGVFAARLAARRSGATRARVIAPGDTPTFLASWPVTVLREVVADGAAFCHLLTRLGLVTLGAFAELPAPAVLARFGSEGMRAHRLARGDDEHAAPPEPPPPDLVESCELDPPATRIDEAAFAAKGLADRLLGRLEALGLACTQIVVEAETEHGERLSRCWRHEGALTPAALATRVRWQLDGWLTQRGAASAREPGNQARSECDHEGGAASAREPGNQARSECDHEGGQMNGGLTLVRIAPDRVVRAMGRQLGFWGGDAAAHDRADRALVRLQGMLGHAHVVTAVPCGGRTPAERVRFVPWGEARDDTSTQGSERPTWPGAVPGPAPARVLDAPWPAALLDAGEQPVTVSSRGEASGEPAWLRCAALPDGGGAVIAWAGPWPQDVRWWVRQRRLGRPLSEEAELATPTNGDRQRRRRALWQIVLEGSVACLVTVESGAAGVEAVYD